MSQSKNIAIVLLSLTTGASAFWAWRAESQLADLQAQARAPSVAASQPAASSPSTRAIARNESHEAAAIPPPPAADRPESAMSAEPPARRPEPEDLRKVRESPEFQRLQNLARQSGLDYRYADLFRKLNLPPADLEKLKALLVERQNIRNDVFAASREEGLNPREHRETIANLIRENEAESDAALRNLLGDSRYEILDRYEATQAERGMTQRIQQRLSYAATPLSEAQSQQLIALLANVRPSQSAARSPGPTINDTIIAQARGFLSPAQVEVLTQIQTELSAAADMTRLIQERGIRRMPPVTMGSD